MDFSVQLADPRRVPAYGTEGARSRTIVSKEKSRRDCRRLLAVRPIAGGIAKCLSGEFLNRYEIICDSRVAA